MKKPFYSPSSTSLISQPRADTKAGVPDVRHSAQNLRPAAVLIALALGMEVYADVTMSTGLATLSLTYAIGVVLVAVASVKWKEGTAS